MSTDRDTTRIVRSWLEEGVTALPDRVLDTVLDQLSTTHQRRSWWPPRRMSQMHGYTRLAIGAAVVLVAAIAGYSLLPRSGSVGNPGTSPSPAPTAGPLPSGSMAAGAYLVSDPTLTLIPYTLTVPSGWIGGDGARRGDDSVGNGVRLTTWIITDVYRNSCHWMGTLLQVHDTATLVAALSAQLGPTHTTPVTTTIGGLSATKMTITLDPAFDISPCDHSVTPHPGVVRLWPDPGPNEGGGFPITPGQSTTIYAISAKGGVMVLMTVQRNDSPAADVGTLQQILDSVQFVQP
jgi:hypothetical protein